jgi:hypothetical protein
MPSTTKKPTLDDLKALMSEFDPREVRALLKEKGANGPTMLSVTMDSLVALGLRAETKALVADVTTRARAAGLLAADATAKANNVAVLRRYCGAYEEARQRAAAAPPA